MSNMISELLAELKGIVSKYGIVDVEIDEKIEAIAKEFDEITRKYQIAFELIGDVDLDKLIAKIAKGVK